MAKIDLGKISTRAPKGWDKEKTKAKTQVLLTELSDLQNRLYAAASHSVLVVIQGMDASGKDGLIRNVFGSMNPQGVTVKSFKAPTTEELAHDFLWRVHPHVPAKGMIQVFNRSHYEDILVTRVHKWCPDEKAKARIKAINDFEQLLVEHNHTHVLKFYLHLSPEEQQLRLKERISQPEKQWKYNANDLAEAKLWKDYRKYYHEALNKCQFVPWTVVPTDQNWYKEWVVANALYQLLKNLDLQYPGLKK
jgi:PPK2 family polyphosphate:nucleotide phosphotransferase